MRYFSWEEFSRGWTVVCFHDDNSLTDFLEEANKKGFYWVKPNDLLSSENDWIYDIVRKNNGNIVVRTFYTAKKELSWTYKDRVEKSKRIVRWKIENKNNMFDKKDLEGRFVELRNGRRGVVINSHIKSETKGIAELTSYDENLENKLGKEWDIMKVSNVRRVMGFSQLFNNPEKYTELIWEREEMNWNNVPKYTKVQVRDDETDKWKNRYFIKYIKEDEEPFYCSLCKKDEFTNFTSTKIPYKYCRLYKED